jgi:hypothetical protein
VTQSHSIFNSNKQYILVGNSPQDSVSEYFKSLNLNLLF